MALLGAGRMRIRLPKPLHGWRAFTGEVGVIVLGVLLALAAQQLAQYVSARQDAAELRKSMVDELTLDRARWEANNHDVACAVKRLDELRAWAARPGSDVFEHFDPPIFWTMHDSAWQIARSSPTMTALPLKERDMLANLYFVIEIQERVLENTQERLSRVDALAKTADRRASRDALPEAAIEAQAGLRHIKDNLVEEEFDRLGVRSNIGLLGRDPFNYTGGCPPIRLASPEVR
jgi:hypothetical protein